MTIEGWDFVHGPVQLYWNSVTGEALGTATGPHFAKTVEVPDASPGAYYIVAVASDQQGSYEHATTFQVLGKEESTPPTGDENPREGSTSGSGSGADSGSDYEGSGDNSTTAGGGSSSSSSGGGSKTSDTTSGSDAGAGSSSGSSGFESSGTPGSGFPAQSGNGAPSASGGVPGGAVVPSAGPSSANPSVLRTTSGQAVFGGSVGVAGGQASGSFGSPEQASNPSVSEASVSGNMWAGMGSLGPSLAPGLAVDPIAEPDDATLDLSFGVWLLGAGLAALFGAFLIAEVRRQRALAGAVSRR